MTATRQRYAAIDVHRPAESIDDGLWPADMPALTAPEAMRAARRLWRFGMGETWRGPVKVTSGRRFNDVRRGVMYVNPSRGWRNLVHELSHDMCYRANPDDRPHSKFHVRFEAKLIREVIKRGWLDGKLRDKPKAAAKVEAPSLNDKRRETLARVEASIERWERKAERARRALAKLSKRQRYYSKVIA